MKKNVLMRAASGLLVATMLTTCAISGTFAKYVTQDNGGDVARVAKWGVVVQVEGDLYGQKYSNLQTDGTGNTVIPDSSTGDIIGVDGQQIAPPTVVAPGSKSDSPFTFGINGTPEVDSQTTIKIDYQNIYLSAGTYGVMVPVADDVVTAANYEELATKGLYYQDSAKNYIKADATAAWAAVETYDFFTLEDYVENAQTYYPVAYTLAGKNTGDAAYDLGDTRDDGAGKKSDNTLKLVSENILEKVGATIGSVSWTETAPGVFSATYTKHVEHNTNLATDLQLQAEAITWEWEFEDEVSDFDDMEETAGYGISQQDKLDTILGNLMAEREHNVPANQTTFEPGQVVKLIDGSTSWAAPEEVVSGDAKDFCLDTQFKIDILVEQVD